MSSYPVMFVTEYEGRHIQCQGYISSNMMISRKTSPANVEFETRAKNLLKAELKRRGVTYAQLAVKLADIGVHETERNLNNKISRGGFSAAFLLQCLTAIGAQSLRLDDS